ncbi:hypothetical protein [Thalassovita aquimarina]|uniref:Uncharacterized protein n=1 Tax=Thalassovita aquimarina TaxID=2785917 RepID=A0ABS5HMM8_9RHOB|nr:hypothetical protein [Thalassovita aquimarina]MBR9650205.1 hypothetical protein [Thalassovita aquimarina]
MTTTFSLDNVPRHLRLPPIDTPILEYWADCFDHAFVALNPFFRVPGYTPETAAYGVVHLDLTNEQLIEHPQSDPPRRGNEAPDNFDDFIKAHGEPVRWSDIQKEIGAKDFMNFARTVWLWTVAVEREDRDPNISFLLDAYCQKHGVYRPEEDQLPAIMEPMLGRFLEVLGIEEVTLWSEWMNVSSTVPASDFATEKPCVSLPREKTSVITAPGFLIGWEFDDVAGLMGISDELRQKADPEQFLEGFWVTPEMYADVFNPVGREKRKPPVSKM